jgi:hypothetical protein
LNKIIATDFPSATPFFLRAYGSLGIGAAARSGERRQFNCAALNPVDTKTIDMQFQGANLTTQR